MRGRSARCFPCRSPRGGGTAGPWRPKAGRGGSTRGWTSPRRGRAVVPALRRVEAWSPCPELYLSCVTITLTCALTSRCSFSATWCSPSVLMGSFRSILWRSISTRCCAFRAAAMSWLVIEPKALSSAPTFKRTTTVLLLISSATAWAAVRSFVSRLTAASRSRLASASAPFPAATASLRRSRKLRPYPSATSLTSPARPTFSTSFVSKTRNSPDLRHGLIFVAVADSRTDSIDCASETVPGGSQGIPHITIPHALLRLQRCLVLGPDLSRASLDERLDGEDAKGQHVQLAEDRDPGGEIQRADDQPQGCQEHGFGRGRNPVVAHQAIGKLAAPRHIDQNCFCPRKYGWQGGRHSLQLSGSGRKPINKRQATKGRR